MGDSVSGERFTSADRLSVRFAADRVCAEDGCTTRLSIYNDGDHCSLHEPMSSQRVRGRRIA